jgi:hypothetical protein
MKKLPLILFLLPLISCAVWAHKDRIIKLDGNQLLGLPEKYQPASFSLSDNTLRIKNHEMIFAPYIEAFFTEENCKLEFFASWYHNIDLLPPYLLIRITPVDRDYYYELHFGLDSLDLIEAKVVTCQKDGSRLFWIDIPDFSMKEIKESITEIE